MHHPRKVPKDQLLEEIFQDGDCESRNNRFYVSLSVLRKALEPDLKSGRLSAYVHQSGELFFLDDRLCSVDLARFMQLTDENGDMAVPELARREEAVQLYWGDLLEEYPYEPQFEAARGRAKRRFAALLRELGQSCWERKEYRRGASYFERLLEQEEGEEETYWYVLDRFTAQGLIPEARAAAGRMLRSLEDELGIPVRGKLLNRYPGLLDG